MINAICLHIVALLIYILITIILVKKHVSIGNQALYLIFYIYVIGVLSVTLFPLPVQKELIHEMANENYIVYNFTPFSNLITLIMNNNISVWFKQIIGNILLFFPLGFLLPLIFPLYNKFRNVLLTGLLSSIGIESIQGMLPFFIGTKYKVVDINDIILNITGIIIGYFSYTLLILLFDKYFKLNAHA